VHDKIMEDRVLTVIYSPIVFMVMPLDSPDHTPAHYNWYSAYSVPQW